MRVALTLEQCWHDVPGGTAVAALETARALQKRHDIDVIGVAARHRRPPPSPWVPPVPTRHLWAPRLLLYELWHARVPFAPRVERATGAVDVVHATAVAYPRADAPVVVTIHDLAFLDDPSRVTKHGMRFFTRGTALARQHARLVMCSSQSTVDDCIRAGFRPEQLRVVPLGVDREKTSFDDIARARTKFGLAQPYVMFAGTVEPRKNLRRLLAAFALVKRPDVELVLAGPTGWNETIATELAALEGRVRVLGFLQPGDRDALIAGAEVFCYPSIKEGFGLPVLEAMAQRVPVVTSQATSTAEVAGDAALLVDPFDVDAIAEAIDRLLEDRALADRLVDAGDERVSLFTWERTAAAVADVYAEAVGASATTAEG